MWCCQTTSSKILPNHIWTHTNNNLIFSSFKISAYKYNLSFINHPKTYLSHLPLSYDLEVLLQVFRHASHFCHIHSESIIRLHLDEVLTAQAQQTHGLQRCVPKFPMGGRGQAVLIDILFYMHPKKNSNLIRDTGYTGYRNGQNWKVIKDFSPFTNASCLVSIIISMNHLDFFTKNWTPSPWNSAPRPMSTLRRRRRQRDHASRRQGRRDGAPSKVPGTSWWSKVDCLF